MTALANAQDGVIGANGPVNYQPVAVPTEAETAQEVSIDLQLVALDAKGDILLFSVETFPEHGTLGNINPLTGTMSYTPAQDYIGADSFRFVVNDGSLMSEPGTVSLSVIPETDLSVGISGAPDPVVLGNNVTYTIMVTNNGPSTATSVMVTDMLPNGVAFIQATPGCTLDNGDVICMTGDIVQGASSEVEIVITPTAEGFLNNMVMVAGLENDPNTQNNSASLSTEVISQDIFSDSFESGTLSAWSTSSN